MPLVAGKDLTVTMPRNWRQKASVKISYDTPLIAPVAKGDTLGKLEVTGQGVPDFTVPCSPSRTCQSWACRAGRWRCCRNT